MSEEISIHREDGAQGGRLVFILEGHQGELTYTRPVDGQMSVNHVGVPPPLENRGLGAKLVARAVEEARKDGLKIRPVCPFAAAMFRRHPEWRDVLA